MDHGNLKNLAANRDDSVVIVEQIWTDNRFRNFNYLIACPETGEALAIDPLEHQQCLNVAADKGWQALPPAPTRRRAFRRAEPRRPACSGPSQGR